ncbi:DUF2490 domain-containing protein [Flavihumibacter petaseus]|uniref:DUF2490 domain-containing protein n=1 Tax=Flavihumibacter petaseus NBRC 106054 TaxID=1220578 RepID=A0A0E9N2I6_9BACT|nr:DUF2490 domain-containing protein [Flavihumibacter petaseus]GAO44008.1 hypothetical protein FPE01S_03_00470 [Flavihumibacter petaseus NBRC 106054]
MTRPFNVWLLGLPALLSVCFNQTLRAQSAAPPPYTMGFIPASISETDIAFPLYEKWHLHGQVDFQLVTQGTYVDQNPFAYAQRTVIRPWIMYSGFRNLKLWLGYAHNKKYEIKEAGNYETLERRIIVMGSIAQNLPKGSMFQQVRFETKFFDDREGVHQAVPRLRARFGVNHYLRQHSSKPIFKAPNISYYTELMLKFADKDYAEEHFDIFRLSVYYSAGINHNLHFLAGMIGQMQLRTNGTQFDVYYGPMISLRYSINKKERETFDNVDASAD